jgi:hypothetical protein
MSEWGAIADAILEHVGDVVAGVKTERGVVALERVRQWPHACAFVLEAGAELVPGGGLQEERSIPVGVLLRFKGLAQEDVYALFDAIRAELYSDRTLDGLVRRLFVQSAAPREDPNSAVIALAITVLCDVVV